MCRATDKILSEIKWFIKIMLNAAIEFYQLRFIGRQRSINRELLENLVTGFILVDDLYILVINLITLSKIDKIRHLEQIVMHNKYKLEDLHVKEKF